MDAAAVAHDEPPARNVGSAWRALVAIAQRPAAAVGAWLFGEGPGGGMVFVERGRICWVVAQGMRRRLTNLLVAQSAAPPAAIAEVLASCKATGAPLGESLVAAGLVTQAGLRRALREHSAACLVRIDPDEEPQFVPSKKHYDAGLTFSGVELLEQVCRAQAGPDARSPVALLDRALRGGGSGVAFAFAEGAPAFPVALRGMDEWTIPRLAKLVARFGDLVPPTSAGADAEAAGFRLDGAGAIAWRVGEIVYLVLVPVVDTVPVRLAGVNGMLRSMAG